MTQLLKIQSELKVPKSQFNSFGKYAYRSAEEILEAVKVLLTKYGCTLTLTDEIKTAGPIIYVETTATICHEGDCVSVKAQAGIDPSRKGMDLSQCFGSSSSYARKYALSGLFLLDDSKDADATNTGGKDTDNKKSELIASVSKLPENKRAAALETINNATDMKTLVIIEDRINKLVQ